MSEGVDLKSTQYIAKAFGLTTRRIEQLTAEGIITPVQKRPRKYDLLPTIQDYIKYLSDKANGKEKKDIDAELETQKLEAEARLKRAKAEAAELELDELRGIMHLAEDVEAIMTDHVLMLRSMLMALPGKLAIDVASIKKPPEAAERIKKEVYEILNRLSTYQYDPEAYKKRVRERQGWNGYDSEDE
ncbi:protoporphyrinogen oxidase [Paenibacillus apiarius]|uniref:protoporphyrinogen oxidase n=1 Tax=Paenibacillus apiarius TaxID=46240 RepID=UPI003B3A71EA